MLIWWRSRSTWHRGGKMHTCEVRVRMRMFYWWEAQTRSGWQSQASKCTTGYRRTILIITSFPFYNWVSAAARTSFPSSKTTLTLPFRASLPRCVCAPVLACAAASRVCDGSTLTHVISLQPGNSSRTRPPAEVHLLSLHPRPVFCAKSLEKTRRRHHRSVNHGDRIGAAGAAAFRAPLSALDYPRGSL